MSRRLSSQFGRGDYTVAESRPAHGGGARASTARGSARTFASASASMISASSWAGYTLSHAGRQVRLGPIAFWVVVGTLVIMAVWTITTGTYFAFREDVLTRLIARQADMQFGY